MYLPAPLVLILFGHSCLCAWPANWPVGPQWANPANRLRWWLDRSHSLIASISHNGMILCAAYYGYTLLHEGPVRIQSIPRRSLKL